MIENLQAPVYNLCNQAQRNSYKQTEVQINAGLARIQDVTRNKLEELHARINKALEPIEALDVEKWRMV